MEASKYSSSFLSDIFVLSLFVIIIRSALIDYHVIRNVFNILAFSSHHAVLYIIILLFHHYYDLINFKSMWLKKNVNDS